MHVRQYMNAVFGNADTRAALGKSIEEGTLSHAILIEGDAGSGKRTLAREIAMSLLCENRESTAHPLPCRQCRACHLVDSDLATDVHYIRRGDKATLGVDAVREMIDDTAMSSVEFDTRLYIFEDTESMTPQAQNALLKIMEEPPEGVKLLLLTQSADSMLTTVRSRARLVRMQRFTAEEIEAYLKEKAPSLLAINAEEARAILLSSGGSIGRATELLSPQSSAAVKKARDEIAAILAALTQPSYIPLFSSLTALPQKRDELSRALLLLHTALCDLILLKRAENPPLSFFPSAEAVPEPLSSLRIGVLFAFVDAAERTLGELERNANVQASLAALASNLRNAKKER